MGRPDGGFIAAIVLAVILFALMGTFAGDDANRVGDLMMPAAIGTDTIAAVAT